MKIPRRVLKFIACVDRHSAMGWALVALIYVVWLTFRHG